MEVDSSNPFTKVTPRLEEGLLFTVAVHVAEIVTPFLVSVLPLSLGHVVALLTDAGCSSSKLCLGLHLSSDPILHQSLLPSVPLIKMLHLKTSSPDHLSKG